MRSRQSWSFGDAVLQCIPSPGEGSQEAWEDVDMVTRRSAHEVTGEEHPCRDRAKGLVFGTWSWNRRPGIGEKDAAVAAKGSQVAPKTVRLAAASGEVDPEPHTRAAKVTLTYLGPPGGAGQCCRPMQTWICHAGR